MRTPLFVFRLRRALRSGGVARRGIAVVAIAAVGAGVLVVLLTANGHEGALPAGGAADQSARLRSEPPPAVVPLPEKHNERMQAAMAIERPKAPGADLSSAAPLEVSQLRSIDGTSFRHGDDIIRLAGVEGPGAGDVCRDANIRWSCGLQARAALHNLVAGRSLSCRPRNVIGDGAFTADCQLPPKGSWPSGDLATLLVRQGWAKPVAGAEMRFGDTLQQAQTEKAGLWRGNWSVIPSER